MPLPIRPIKEVVLNEDAPKAEQNVVILRKWNGGQRQRVTSLSMAPLDVIETQAAKVDGKPPRILIDLPRQRIETVKACVESWSGPMLGDLQVTSENIEGLDPADLDKLADACDQLNQGLSDDSKNASGSPTSGGS